MLGCPNNLISTLPWIHGVPKDQQTPNIISCFLWCSYGTTNLHYCYIYPPYNPMVFLWTNRPLTILYPNFIWCFYGLTEQLQSHRHIFSQYIAPTNQQNINNLITTLQAIHGVSTDQQNTFVKNVTYKQVK